MNCSEWISFWSFSLKYNFLCKIVKFLFIGTCNCSLLSAATRKKHDFSLIFKILTINNSKLDMKLIQTCFYKFISQIIKIIYDFGDEVCDQIYKNIKNGLFLGLNISFFANLTVNDSIWRLETTFNQFINQKYVM